MNAQIQSASTATTDTVKTLDVHLDTPTSLAMLKELESMADALILIGPEDQSGPSWKRPSQAVNAYPIHISGSETCHKLILKADGTWYIQTVVGI